MTWPSIHFFHPLVLLLLVPLIPLFLWWWFRQRRGAVRFPDVSSIRNLPAGRSRPVRWTGGIVRLLALICLVAALAGPHWPDEGARIPVEGIAIAIVLDVSGSMAEEDFDWEKKKIKRLDAAKKVFRLFVEGGTGPNGNEFSGRRFDLVSLVVFAKRPETACPLTLNHEVMLGILDKQQPRKLLPETNIGDAIAWAVNSLNQVGKGRKVIVLLSDGEHNVKKPALKPRQAAQLAGNLKTPIYVIDAGKDSIGIAGLEKDAVNRERAKKILEEVARISKGKYFQAQDTKTLLEVSNQIDRMERAPTKSYIYLRYHRGFAWFALSAFVLLAGIQMLEWTLWRQIP